MLIGAIEAGGTKFKCAVAKTNYEIIDTIIIPTTTFEETLAKVVAFFNEYQLYAIGVAAFGPINLNKYDPNYGMLTTTPKLGWQNCNIYRYLKEKLNVKVYINTDVAIAAYGEYQENKKNSTIIYITVGTGIGAGVIYKGKILQGNHHSEMGHFLINKRSDDNFDSVCPYHNNCLEGLASGLALNKRYHLSHNEMSLKNDIWDLEGYYLAQAIYNYTLSFAPDKIIIGGGVSHQDKLFVYVKKYFLKLNNGYFNYLKLEDLDKYIVRPSLKEDSAIYGALALANGEDDVC